MKYVEGPYKIKLCYCIKKQDPKRKIGFLIFYLPHFSLKKFLDPFISQKKILPIIGFMVLKTTGLSSWFQRKNRFWKICTRFWDINQNVPKFRSPNHTFIFSDILVNFSGPSAYFSKTIFVWKPWAQASHFEYHKY